MGRAPCCSKVGLHRGPWSAGEDKILIEYIQAHGEGKWRSLPKNAGLLRCGKSCRLRWVNYLRPDIKRGNITPEEKDLIIRLHSLLGNRWALIAGRLPGRTDNEIKNYWNTHLSKTLNNKAAGSDQNNQKGASKYVKDPKKNEQDSANGEMIKIKVHIPKAIRVSPSSIARNTNIDSIVSGSSFDHGDQGNNGIDDHDLSWACWSDLNEADDGGEALVCEKGNDFVYNYDGFEYDSSESRKDEVLNKIYEEYQQIFQAEDNDLPLEFFVDSLLI